MFALGFKYISGEKVQAIWSPNGTALLKLAKALRSVNFMCWVSGEGIVTNSRTTSDGVVYNDHPIDVVEVGDPNGDLLFNKIYVGEKSGKHRWASESQSIVSKGSRYTTAGWPRDFEITYGKDGSIAVAPVAAPAPAVTDTPKAAPVAAPAPVAKPIAAPKAAPAADCTASETIGVVVDKIINGMKTTISMLREKLAASEAKAAASEKRAADAERRAADAEKKLDEAMSLNSMLKQELDQFSEEAEGLPDDKPVDTANVTETATQRMHRGFREKYSVADVDVMGRPITRIKAEAPASTWKPEIRMDIADYGHLTVECDSACDSKVFEERDTAMKQLLGKIFVNLPEDTDPNGWRTLCRYIEEGTLYEDCLDVTINGILSVENYCYDKSESARKALGLPTLAELHIFQDSNGYEASDNDADPHDDDVDFDFNF